MGGIKIDRINVGKNLEKGGSKKIVGKKTNKTVVGWKIMRKLKKADVQNFKTGLRLGRRPNIISLFIIKILKKKKSQTNIS